MSLEFADEDGESDQGVSENELTEENELGEKGEPRYDSTSTSAGVWTCRHCDNKNYAYRERCNMRKCRAPRYESTNEENKSAANGLTRASGDGKEQDSKRSRQMRDGDWICKKCSNVNFATRVRCNMRKCQAPREEWVCPVCKNVNYKFRTRCNMRRCQAPRPLETYTTYQNTQPRYGSPPGYGLIPPPGSGEFNFQSQPSSIGQNQNYPQLQALLSQGPMSGPGFPVYPRGDMRGSGDMRDLRGDMIAHHLYGGGDFHGGPDFRRGEFREFRGGEFRGGEFRGGEFRGGDFHGGDVRSARGRGSSTERGGHTSFPRELREGDWKCQECGNINFANRTKCNMRKCRAERQPSS